MDKVNAMKEFRKEEFFVLLNKQYANVQLQEPKKVQENSIVLVRNIGNEPKKEPLKLARIEKIHASRDNAQRVVTLTYNNIRVNKEGEWIGTPITVERCINDLILVDEALNDSMLNPRLLKKSDDQKNDENKQDEEVESDDTENDKKKEESNEEDDKDLEVHEIDEVDNETGGNNSTEGDKTDVRKSSRTRKQRMIINDEEIGDCDDKNDPDYIR